MWPLRADSLGAALPARACGQVLGERVPSGPSAPRGPDGQPSVCYHLRRNACARLSLERLSICLLTAPSPASRGFPWASWVAQLVKNLPAMLETWV